MSLKRVTSMCLVIDASIARAAGPPESKHPTGAVCREFLQKVRGVCHRVAWNDAIKAEWEKHQSTFAKTWFVSMFSLRKVRRVPDEPLDTFREAVEAHSDDAGVVAVMLKDAHLVEAALASDLRIASLDDTVRGHFCRMSSTCQELRQVFWVNPTTPDEGCIPWIESGAPDESSRTLRADPIE
jgi:hypothetical protein